MGRWEDGPLGRWALSILNGDPTEMERWEDGANHSHSVEGELKTPCTLRMGSPALRGPGNSSESSVFSSSPSYFKLCVIRA